MTDFASCLVRSWTHAHEEDANDLMVFRPSDHAFPRARGRRGLTFHADGRVDVVGIGPTDRRVTTTGGWQLLRENAVILSFADLTREPYVLEIVACSPESLVVRRLS